jgi:hypothetical protein
MFEGIPELINKYGILTITAASAIFLLTIFIKGKINIYLKNGELELRKKEIELSHKEQFRPEFDFDFIMRKKIRGQIYTKIKEFLSKFNADKMMVFLFHNGTQDICNICNEMYSCKYEEVRNVNIKKRKELWQNIDISTASPILEKLYPEDQKVQLECDAIFRNEQGVVCIHDTQKLEKHYSSLYKTLNRQGIKSSYFVRMLCFDSKVKGKIPIGFISIDFSKKTILPDIDMHEIKNYATSISILHLELKDYNLRKV